MHADSTLARQAAGDAPAARRSRVLLVEDNTRLAASIRDYLARHSYEVYIEGDGSEVQIGQVVRTCAHNRLLQLTPT